MRHFEETAAVPDAPAALTHQALLNAACAGDAVALGRLVELYRDRVYHYGRSVCASDADADDAVQEAFTALGHTLPGLRGQSSLSYWLFTIVRNTCRRFLRPTKTRQRLEHLLDVAEGVLTPDEQVERAQLTAAVQRAIAGLEQASREVVLLRDVEGFSGEETALRLGISVQAMKSRLHRARRELKLAIEAPPPYH